jgi:diacylglycerol kinase (ATP)
MIKKRRGLSRVYHALLNSKRGLRFILNNEAAFKQELILFLVLSPFAFIIGQSLSESILLLLSLWMVLVVEVINTSIEVVVDRIGLDHHDLSGLAKDLGSAAVMMALIFAFFVWFIFAILYFSKILG